MTFFKFPLPYDFRSGKLISAMTNASKILESQLSIKWWTFMGGYFRPQSFRTVGR